MKAITARKEFDSADLPQSRRITDVQLYFRNGWFNSQHWVTVGHLLLDIVKKSEDDIGSYLGLQREDRLEDHGL